MYNTAINQTRSKIGKHDTPTSFRMAAKTFNNDHLSINISINNMPYDNPQEKFYHVDKQDNVIGSITRKEAHSGSKKIHRSIGVFVLRTTGSMLFQQRSFTKDMDPGAWSYSVTGHVLFGQSYKQTAMQELKEELNIQLSSLEFIAKSLIKMENEVEFTALFKTHIFYDVCISPDPSEVIAVRWIQYKKIQDFVSKNKVTSWTKEALKIAKYL